MPRVENTAKPRNEPRSQINAEVLRACTEMRRLSKTRIACGTCVVIFALLYSLSSICRIIFFVSMKRFQVTISIPFRVQILLFAAVSDLIQ